MKEALTDKAARLLPLVEALPDPLVRNLVATTVWWDFFSAHRDPSGNRFGFKKYLNARIVDIPFAMHVGGLYAVGYTLAHAQKRARRKAGLPPYGEINGVPSWHSLQKGKA